VILPLLLAAAAAARTQCPATAAEVRGKLDATFAAFQAMDERAYDQRRGDLTEHVACLAERAPPLLARDLHLLESLDRYQRHDNPGALLALRAVLAIDPGYAVSTDLVPEGNEFRGLLAQARRLGSGPPSVLLRPREGEFFVDGLPAAGERPSDRAALVQWVAPTGRVCWTAHLDPVQRLPAGILTEAATGGGLQACIDRQGVFPRPSDEGPVATAPPLPPPDPEPEEESSSLADLLAPVEPLPTEPPPPRWHALAKPTGFSAIGCGAVAGGLLAATLVSRARLLEEAERCAAAEGCGKPSEAVLDDLNSRERRVRALGYGAQSALGLAAGLGVVAVVTVKL